MKINTLYLVAVMIVALVSCGNPKKENNADIEIENKEVPAEQRAQMALYDEVIEIHDEIMPQMEDMMSAKGKLQEKLDTLRDQDSANPAIPELESAINSLAEADEAMMNWMRKFTPQEDVEDHQAVINYYQDQKVKITEVKQQMSDAMTEANRLLKEN